MSRRKVQTFRRWAAPALSAALLLTLGGVGLANGSEYALRGAIREQLARHQPPPAVAAFYAARAYRPIWTQPAGAWPFWTKTHAAKGARNRAAMAMEAVGLGGVAPPGRRLLAGLARDDLGPPERAAEIEVALTTMLAGHAETLAKAREGELAFVDPAFPASAPTGEFLAWASQSPSELDDIRALNPVYDRLLAGLAAYRREWSGLPQGELPAGAPIQQGDRGARVKALRARLGLADGEVFDAGLVAAVARFQVTHGLPATGVVDSETRESLNLGAAHFERRIVANLKRARGLPRPLTDRFILVNPAAGRLWLYEGGRAVGDMKAIVGSVRHPTPNMVGLIRYMVYNPSWEIPIDIAQQSIAPVVVRQGAGYLDARGIKVLSDWSDAPQLLGPAAVDWRAVMAGRQEVRLRQVPGPGNPMGALKFMLPNELGIYLHDTPDRALFKVEGRQLSAGCIRVERPHDLAAWIREGQMLNPAFVGPEQIEDQFSPVTVYITYLTAAPTPDGVRFYPDVYGRDGDATGGPTIVAALTP